MRRKPWPNLDDVQHICVVKPSSLGDVIHTLPAVAWLRENWPQAGLSWVVNAEWSPILRGGPLVDRVVEFPRRDFRGLRGSLRSLPWFRTLPEKLGGVPKVVLDFQGLLRSALIAHATGSTQIVGLADAREGARHLHDFSVKTKMGAHAIERYLALVQSFGPRTGPERALAGDWLPQGKSRHQLPDGYVLVHPFSRGSGKSLGWAEVVVLAGELRGVPLVVVGRTTEAAPPLPTHVTNLVNGTELPELIALTRRARAVVSVDSGPMHLASALGRPLLGIHTWSDPRRVGPWSATARVWKGGHILRRTEVDDALARADVAPSAADLREIAQFVRSRWLVGTGGVEQKGAEDAEGVDRTGASGGSRERY